MHAKDEFFESFPHAGDIFIRCLVNKRCIGVVSKFCNKYLQRTSEDFELFQISKKELVKP